MGRGVSVPCGAAIVAYQDVNCEDQWDWDNLVECWRDYAIELWPSLYPSDGWIGREDRILAENAHGSFGVSEYCGCVALWFVPVEDSNLAIRWSDQIKPKFLETFGTLRKLGTFSNGESVYERIIIEAGE